MNKRLAALLVPALLWFITASAIALEKKPLEQIDLDEMLGETQISTLEQNQNHFAVFWWIPLEYWQAALANSATGDSAETDLIIELLADVSILAVVQADISTAGDFNFYSLEDVKNNLSVTYTDGQSQPVQLQPEQTLDPPLQFMLDALKPALSNSMGEFGNNFHFYVFRTPVDAQPRLVDPYRSGRLTTSVSFRDRQSISADIEMPLNSLYVPRQCPNGKNAHISWNYCPWSGTQLEDTGL